MGQKGIQRLKCLNDDHVDDIDSVCYNKECQNFRLICSQCLKEGYHNSHPNDVKWISSLIEYIENHNKEFDKLVNHLNKVLESVIQLFSEFIKGISYKYSFEKERLQKLNSKQINEFVNSAMNFTEYKQQIMQIIPYQIQKLDNTFKTLKDQLDLQQLSYYRINDQDMYLSTQIYNKSVDLFKDQKYNESIEKIESSLSLYPNDLQAFLLKGKCLMKLQKYQDAIVQFDTAYKLDSKHFESLLLKGLCLSYLGRSNDAIISSDKALTIKPNDFIALVLKSTCLVLSGNCEDAITPLDKAFTIQSNNPMLTMGKGKLNSNLMKRQYKNAIIYQNLDVSMLIIKILMMLRRYETAIFYLNKVLTINPKDYAAIKDKGQCLRMLGRYQDEIIWLDKALTKNPSDVETLSCKGECLRMLGKFQDAIIWLDKALTINPNNVMSQYGKGQCLKMLGRHDEAIIQFDITLTINTNDVFSLWVKSRLNLNLIIRLLLINYYILNNIQRYEKIIIFLDEVSKISLNDKILLMFKGCSLRMLHKYENAIFYLDQALTKDIDEEIDFIVFWFKGDCLKWLGRYENAIIWLDKALFIKPNNVITLSNKGDCLILFGRYQDAIICFNQVLTIIPNHDYSKRAIDQCLKLIAWFNESLQNANQVLSINNESIFYFGELLEDQLNVSQAILNNYIQKKEFLN